MHSSEYLVFLLVVVFLLFYFRCLSSVEMKLNQSKQSKYQLACFGQTFAARVNWLIGRVENGL